MPRRVRGYLVLRFLAEDAFPQLENDPRPHPRRTCRRPSRRSTVNATRLPSRARTTSVADLVLSRYALPQATPKKVRDDVGKLLDSPLSGAECDEIRAELESAGLLSRGRRNSVSLSDAGRQRALSFLGLFELPPRMNWGAVIAKHLFPKAVGLSAEAAA